MYTDRFYEKRNMQTKFYLKIHLLLSKLRKCLFSYKIDKVYTNFLVRHIDNKAE